MTNENYSGFAFTFSHPSFYKLTTNMSPKQDQGPTYSEIIQSLLDIVEGPIHTSDLIEQILLLRSSTSKNPAQAVRNKLREEVGRLLVFLDKETILPMRLVMKDVCFRLQLNQDAVQSGLVEIGVLLKPYLPLHFAVGKIRFIDDDGHPFKFQLKRMTRKEVDPFFGEYTTTFDCADLENWLKNHKAKEKDYIWFTIQDWQNGVFQLQFESYAERDAVLLAQRNQQFADLLYEMLESSTQEQLYQHEAIPTVYAKMPDKSGYPPDHWMNVLESDERMIADGWSIRYRDGQLSPLQELERMLSGEAPDVPLVSISKEQGKQVYRIKAEYTDKTAIWREVEILGKQTLADLSSTLVGAFGYDSDHMAGFWKLVPRKGSGKVRYREVELGRVNPFEGGDGAEIQIASIGLVEGDKLKFVFDFGDWLEHTLTIEAITESKAGVEYPRETARNKPKYVYCVNCKEEGRQTIAQLICLTCCNKHQKEMVYCEACAESHEDHYVDEILY